MSKRPRRQRKADTILHGNLSPREIQCDYALGPLDRLAHEMDKKWGIDRLPDLVSTETATKYGSAMAKLNSAIESNDPQETATRAEVCIRGMRVMDQEAEAAGKPTADQTVWEYELDGVKFGIMADDCAWQSIKAQRPDLMLFTMREVALALNAYKLTGDLVQSVKDKFPAAQVTKIKNKLPDEFFENGGDEIKF